MPKLKNLADDIQPCKSDGLGRTAAIDAFLKIPLEMGPADLPQPYRPALVHPPAIRTENAVNGIAQKLDQARQAAALVDDKGRHAGSSGHPQPTLVARLFPAGLIDVLDLGLLHRLQCLGMR